MKKLSRNCRIGIIGGGPAGAFCANFLLFYEKKEDFPLRITIYEGKVFESAGVRGCNLCVGILANSLIEKLSQIGLEIPERIIQRSIDSYKLVTEIGEITLEKDERRRIYTVYRGGGPKGFKFVEPISFDNFLLESAVARGAILKKSTIARVIPPGRGDDPYVLEGLDGERFEEDVVIGAFGVNSSLKREFEAMNFGYNSPQTVTAYQAEFHLGERIVDEKFRNTVSVFLLRKPKLDFGLIVPKKSQVTVSLVGRGLKKQDVDAFLEHPLVRSAFPSGWSPDEEYCYCVPHLPVSPAVKPFADRLVVIGDASISRFYKNGIQSAYFTAKFAAETIFYHGVDSGSFRRHYWRWSREKYFYDNLYGKSLFFASLVIKRSEYLSRIMLNVARGGWASREANAERLRKVYWNMFTGNTPYYYIMRDLLNLRLQADLLKASVLALVRRRNGDAE